MATWSILGAGSGIPATDGTYIYTLDVGNRRIFRFEPVSEDLDIIGDFAAEIGVAGGIGVDLVYFNNAIFFALTTDDSIGQITIKRWDISSETWSDAYTEASHPSIDTPDTAKLMVANNQIVYFANNPDVVSEPGATHLLIYSSNGVSWSNASLSGLGATDTFSTLRQNLKNHQNRNSIYDLQMRLESAAEGDRRLQWTGSGFTDVAAFVGDFFLSDSKFHWRQDSNYEYSTDLATWNTPTDTTVVPVPEVNMPWPVGYRRDGAFVYITYWKSDVGQWQDEELILGGVVTSGGIRHVFRFNNGETYLQWFRDGSVNWLHRDEPITEDFPEPSTSGNRLWIYKITKQPDGSYTSINRGIKTA